MGPAPPTEVHNMTLSSTYTHACTVDDITTHHRLLRLGVAWVLLLLLRGS